MTKKYKHDDSGACGSSALEDRPPIPAAPSSISAPLTRSGGPLPANDNDETASQQQLRTDHPLFRQRGQREGDADGEGEECSPQKIREEAQAAAQEPGEIQPQLLTNQTKEGITISPSSSHPSPSSSLLQLPDASSPTKPSKIPLTRTFSTPESSTKYNNRPLITNNEFPSTTTTFDHQANTDDDDDDEEIQSLKKDYPLLLQRSASSAFGSPSKFSNHRRNMMGGRTGSNSGNSDPGISAFHPVWSCKSLSASSAESASDIGSAIGSSTVGSAVSTSVSSIVKSAHSDPSDQSKFQKNKHSSPWRRVMNRMNQSLGMGRGGSGNAGGSGGGSGNGAGKGGFRRSLSGRENPARPNLSEDEGGNSPVSPVNELPVVVGLPNDMLQLSLGGITAGVGENLTAKSAGGSKSSGSETRKTGSKKGTRKKKSRSSTVSASAATKDNGEEKKVASKASLKESTAETQYDDPGVELDLSDSEDEDEISINDSGRIIGNRIPLHEGNVTEAQKQQTSSTSRPSSVELPHPPSMGESSSCDYGGVEAFLHNRPLSSISHVATAGTVMEEMTFGSVQIISPSFEENSPPTVERCMVAVNEGDENDVHFPYHPLGGRNDEGIEASNAQQGANYAVDASSTIPMRLKYRSPQRSLPPSSATPSPQHRTSNNSNNEHSPSASSHDSPNSRLSSSAGSPTSRISSSSTRTGGADSGASISCATTLSGGDRTINTLQTEGSLVVDGMDYEVREANRRSFSMRGRSNIGSGIGDVGNRHEAIGSPSDGNETVFSSSTTSSNYHSYLQSPRPLREGATMPVERFFAGGNVAMSPMAREVYPVGESSTASLMSMAGAPNIISLSPKKISRISAGSGSSSSGNHSHRDAAHSPHTVSSHSVSANSSSSGSEALMKKPLKFVAYANREERESPFDEPPIASGISSINRGHHTASLIKPRISKVGTNPQQRHRPPMIQHRASATPYNNNNPQSSNTKPPQSPRKQDVAYALRLSGARTPTRTPPPSSYRDMLQSSGANTPCSPPVIVDGPTNVLCGDLSIKPKRPCVVRRSSAPVGASGGRGMILIPPSGASYRSHLTHPHIPPRPTPASSMSSPSRDNLTVMTTGIGVNDADDGAQEIVLTSTTSGVSTSSMEGGATASTLISPDNRQSLLYGNTGRRLHNLDNATEKKTDHVGRNVGSAIVSPEKGL